MSVDVPSTQMPTIMTSNQHSKCEEDSTKSHSTRGLSFLPDIDPNATWKQDGVTVAGCTEYGRELHQLTYPEGLCVDDDQTVYIADYLNHRIVAWKSGATSGQIVAGGKAGNWSNQLNEPTDVFVDKQTDSLFISDWGNRRVVRWPRRGGECGEIVMSDIDCWGLTMDDDGSLYVSDSNKNEVRRWRMSEASEVVVAGINGKGHRLDQLNLPTYIFVDQDRSVYVSDCWNNRVMKWVKHAKEGIVVAGGQGLGDALKQLSDPNGVAVDKLGTVYVADFGNDRIMRWPKGATQGSVIVGGNGTGHQANQLNRPRDVSFDQHGNLYVVDQWNHRVQRFSINNSS